MPLSCALFIESDTVARTLELALRATGKVVINGSDPEIAVVEVKQLAAVKARLPQATLMAFGPLEADLLMAAMRAGATEYLEWPLREGQLDEALGRCLAGRSPATALRPTTRGKLMAIVGARGGCGATTVAVNLALAMQAQRRQNDGPVVLLDAAPLGHAALQLNVKPQFTIADLLSQVQRLDLTMLSSLMVRHGSGLELLAGPAAPLPPTDAAHYTTWVELLLTNYPLVVVDLSARLDNLTKAVLELADRILFVTQTDMVSLWSAAKVRQYLDPQARMKFEIVLNRHTATPDVDIAGLESVTRATVLWKVPNAHAQVVEAIERGRPPAGEGKSELAKNYRNLAIQLLGRTPSRKRGWLPFLRTREVAG